MFLGYYLQAKWIQTRYLPDPSEKAAFAHSETHDANPFPRGIAKALQDDATQEKCKASIVQDTAIHPNQANADASGISPADLFEGNGLCESAVLKKEKVDVQRMMVLACGGLHARFRGVSSEL